MNKISVLAELTMVNRVRCAVIFCTYRREKNIVDNVGSLLRGLKKQDDFGYKVIVVDNGRTLTEGMFDQDVLLVGNINSGGSGGFRKGMEVAADMGGFTHFILMDDDVEFDFVSIQKMLNFMRFLKPEYSTLSMSGSMLYKDKPTFQFEAGGHFGRDGRQKSFGHFLDLSRTDSLSANEGEREINYAGWWLMCMPFRYIEEGRFPSPFFLKYDDVEYALRCGLDIITMNGVGVWHEKYETKYNSSTEYYNMRNYLFLCSLYCENFTRKRAGAIARRRIREKERRQQYKMAEAVRLGYEDFLKGPDYLESLDPEANHEKICGLNYEFIPYDDIQRSIGVRPADGQFYPVPGRRQMLNPKTWLPKRVVFTDRFYDSPVQYFLAGMAVHCSSETNCGYVTRARRGPKN